MVALNDIKMVMSDLSLRIVHCTWINKITVAQNPAKYVVAIVFEVSHSSILDIALHMKTQ